MEVHYAGESSVNGWTLSNKVVEGRLTMVKPITAMMVMKTLGPFPNARA